MRETLRGWSRHGLARSPSEAGVDKARRLRGWSSRSNEDAIVAAAESLLELGIVKREIG
ncbi:hypothetical protein [Bradyrhizobium sp. HKCCYLRH1030]|uniref:hypothetical protein n=1 Tax=Bradyrhizobium sp. HKCCYLRH1030 TaxID=3420744 RepID=UPI003EBD1CB6